MYYSINVPFMSNLSEELMERNRTQNKSMPLLTDKDEIDLYVMQWMD